jgi:hypothetical protein
MIGSDLKMVAGSERDKSVEVVRNHEDGTRMGTGIPIPKEDRTGSDARTGAAATRSTSGRRTFRLRTMEGRSLDNPMRGNPAALARARPGSQGPERVGKVGAKVRRVARDELIVRSRGPIEGPRGPGAATRRRSRRAAANGQGAATSIGFFPPQEAPHGAVAWRDHAPVPCADAPGWLCHRSCDTCTRRNIVQTKERCSQRPTSPAERGRRRNRKEPLAPVDQVNHIPVRRAVPVAPKGDIEAARLRPPPLLAEGPSSPRVTRAEPSRA